MRTITKEEAAKRNLQPLGKKHPVRAEIEKLETGKFLVINPQDYAWTTHTLNYFCKQITEKTGKKFIVYKDKGTNGWAVERTE